MTEQELYIRLNLSSDKLQILNKFFSQNVAIPRGENRHPYADVIHAWVEGSEMQVKLARWVNCTKMKDFFDFESEYRIKPQEPVYEWQWDTKLPDSTWEYYKEGDKTHFTDEEIGKKANWLCKVEHTKRERKQ